MVTVDEQIRIVEQTICHNIEVLSGQRDLLAQNIVSQLRTLIESISARLHVGGAHEFNYQAIEPGLAFVRSQAQLNFLGKFHNLIQISASHYTVDGDSSERLMLKYLEYMIRIKNLMRDRYGIHVLRNLDQFPVDLDPALREYHTKIAAQVDAMHSLPVDDTARRYYIDKTRPFFVDGKIYYEVTFSPAINRVSKFDRVTAFTDIDVTDNYSSMLWLANGSIDVFDRRMPIIVIRGWEVSIRPWELNNLARLFGQRVQVRTNSLEYLQVMRGLTAGRANLLGLLDAPEHQYAAIREAATASLATPQIFPILDEARRLTRSGAPGSNIVRYLMLRMRNRIVKSQYARDQCGPLSELHLDWGCIPFETMPLCTNPKRHIPSIADLRESVSLTGRNHELLARRIKNNVEQHGMLYTPLVELGDFNQPIGPQQTAGTVADLVATYNSKVFYRHAGRRLVIDKGHVVMQRYEDDTVAIIKRLRGLSQSGVPGHQQSAASWMATQDIEDEAKRHALENLFVHTKIALIYGAAGTGKTTLVDLIARYFHGKPILLVAHTNTAVDNLKRRVDVTNGKFDTIRGRINASPSVCDVLVIDECSTVSNEDLLALLDNVTFKLLVLVGDVHQIESIQFGNWFSLIREFIPANAVFELTKPYRTTNQALLGFWDKVRNIEPDIAEAIARNGFAKQLDGSLLQRESDDEIVLCLNYDGLYGINNINRFMQASNSGYAVDWGAATYKVGDPVLFSEVERFRPLLYNSLKGQIRRIERLVGAVQFDIKVDRVLDPVEVQQIFGNDLVWVDDTTVRFLVYEYDLSEDDDDSLHTTVPFQVAYAVSIHKAQGLEYESVKIVITDEHEEQINHSIFYTAVTRARDKLQIFWSPETQQAVIGGFRHRRNPKDARLLEARRDLTPL
ncbi:ATP-dependent RecD-like DNA helicase [Nocardioides sp. QY071]|uniref:ATP-dependent DNA helicase n=1 Tax=Nocardioides sp. QY071 TaxID=3044187 RepID=UPI00249AD845|nr:ATP-dependent RecD-like DNA helicase [Nocardioides sp. QY071]WGY01807.1 ATP-dependent RecD-like DNA helicase [Nocardioides sp. QY071]